MAKPKKSAHSGPHKNHGPKRKMFHKSYNSCERVHMAQLGVLSKYYDKESWTLACMARGIKNPSDSMWADYCNCVTIEKKKAWFQSLKKRKA